MLNIDSAKVEVPYKVRWWGSDCVCDPRFVEQALGDGNVLLGLQPLNTRPHYYVIRVDSRWHLVPCRECESDCPDLLFDHLDEIYEAIENEYCSKEEEEEFEDDETPSHTGWPVLNLDCGSSWFTIDPAKFLASFDASK